MRSSKTDTPPQKMRAAARQRRTKKILAPVTTWPFGQVTSDHESISMILADREERQSE
jgi:hypothetical protein